MWASQFSSPPLLSSPFPSSPPSRSSPPSSQLPPQGIERIVLSGMPTRRLLMESPSLPTLKHLIIASDDDLTELPVDLLRLTSLRELLIWGCPNLETLQEGMSRLQELKLLRIYDCPPKLRDKCGEGGLLWPSIRHIPTIEIDWRTVERKN